MRKVLLLSMLTLILVVALGHPGIVGAQNNGNDLAPNYAFVPNSGEASVSKVDVVSNTSIARYWTAPRLGDEINLVGEPAPGNANVIPPSEWRTSRIVLDAQSNAWVINTGADGTNLQGSIVRIKADTEGLITNDDHDNPLTFGTDEAVQVFPVGTPGDMPRAITVDGDGYIWVGFYSGAQLMKYEYDEASQTLTPVDGPFFPDTEPNNAIRYYDMEFAPDGTLFISSRGSTPTRTPRQEGIWTFDGTDFARETEFNPYAILIADDGTVYATAYNNLLYIRDKDTEDWTSVEITGSSQNRGMAFDGLGNIWIASTVGTSGGTVVHSYNITSGLPGPTYTLTSGTTPVGVEMDAAGNIWVVCRTDNPDENPGYLEGFDPVTLAQIGAIEVGYRPYAYRDFILPVFRLCGFKYLGHTEQGLQGWQIILERQLQDAWVEQARTTTDADGSYCFESLLAGRYRIRETVQLGWTQVYPIPNEHLVTLPDGASDPEAGPFYNFENKPPAVGGDAYPVSRLVLLAPWVALVLAVFAGAGLLLHRRRAV